jgi:hypothetical protein
MREICMSGSTRGEEATASLALPLLLYPVRVTKLRPTPLVGSADLIIRRYASK